MHGSSLKVKFQSNRITAQKTTTATTEPKTICLPSGGGGEIICDVCGLKRMRAVPKKYIYFFTLPSILVYLHYLASGIFISCLYLIRLSQGLASGDMFSESVNIIKTSTAFFFLRASVIGKEQSVGPERACKKFVAIIIFFFCKIYFCHKLAVKPETFVTV